MANDLEVAAGGHESAARGADEGMLALLFAAIDAHDADAFCDFLTEDARFVFGNAPPAVGRPAIRAMVRGFFSSIRACRHEVTNALRDGDTVVCRGIVTYTRHDGRAVPLPFCNVMAMRGRRIADYQIYSDPAPLFAP
jgi:ketosteroid isomerase-like protein